MSAYCRLQSSHCHELVANKGEALHDRVSYQDVWTMIDGKQ